MHLSELYRAKVQETIGWKKDAVGKPWKMEEHFLNKAWAAETQANSLAHCIAFLGDFDITVTDFSSMRKLLPEVRWSEISPWEQGLQLAEATQRSCYPRIFAAPPDASS